jgi:hypothetical protein
METLRTTLPSVTPRNTARRRLESANSAPHAARRRTTASSPSSRSPTSTTTATRTSSPAPTTTWQQPRGVDGTYEDLSDLLLNDGKERFGFVEAARNLWLAEEPKPTSSVAWHVSRSGRSGRSGRRAPAASPSAGHSGHIGHFFELGGQLVL